MIDEVQPRIYRIPSVLGPRRFAQWLVVGDDRLLLIDSGVDGTIEEHVEPALPEIGRSAGGDHRRRHLARGRRPLRRQRGAAPDGSWRAPDPRPGPSADRVVGDDRSRSGTAGTAARTRLRRGHVGVARARRRSRHPDRRHRVRRRRLDLGGITRRDRRAARSLARASRRRPRRVRHGDRDGRGAWSSASTRRRTSGSARRRTGRSPPYRGTVQRLRALGPARLGTSHYAPIEGRDAVTAFLDGTARFVDELDAAVRAELGPEPRPLEHYWRTADAAIGPFSEMAVELARSVGSAPGRRREGRAGGTRRGRRRPCDVVGSVRRKCQFAEPGPGA